MSTVIPRRIDPALVEIGDKITVVRSLGNGIMQTLTGTVVERIDNGATRTYRTREGGVLFAWEPGRPKPALTLLVRASASQTPLWEDEIRERIA